MNRTQANRARRTRTQTGLGILTAAAVLTAAGCASSTPHAEDAGPSAETVMLAEQAGVGLGSTNPQLGRDRMVEIHRAGRTTHLDQLSFADGQYRLKSTGELFSGHAADTYPNGALRSVHGIVGGRTEGFGVWFYESGSMWIATRFREGRVRGQLLEFFPSGTMRLRVVAHGPSPKGGTHVEEICVGSYADGGYSQETLGSGRLQLILPDGSTRAHDQAVSVRMVSGYKLFERGFFGERTRTEDSRVAVLTHAPNALNSAP